MDKRNALTAEGVSPNSLKLFEKSTCEKAFLRATSFVRGNWAGGKGAANLGKCCTMETVSALTLEFWAARYSATSRSAKVERHYDPNAREDTAGVLTCIAG